MRRIRKVVRLDYAAGLSIRAIARCLKASPSTVREYILRGNPGYIRSDNGSEFVAKVVRGWIVAVGAHTAFIEPSSPWENRYIESFNARLRDELVDGEFFYTLKEVQVLIKAWRCHYNTIRPHGRLGYRPPAPETIATPSSVAQREPNALTFNLDPSMGPVRRLSRDSFPEPHFIDDRP